MTRFRKRRWFHLGDMTRFDVIFPKKIRVVLNADSASTGAESSPDRSLTSDQFKKRNKDGDAYTPRASMIVRISSGLMPTIASPSPEESSASFSASRQQATA